MYWVTKYDPKISPGTEFACDERADVETIPTDNIAPGSACLVLADSSLWMLNKDKIWKEIE